MGLFDLFNIKQKAKENQIDLEKSKKLYEESLAREKRRQKIRYYEEHPEELMYTFKISTDNDSAKEYSIRWLDEYGMCLAYIHYRMDDGKITIHDCMKTEYAESKYSNYDIHLGTSLFNKLLEKVKDEGCEILVIEGLLSKKDNDDGYWKKSITFYCDIPQYINCNKLGYKLKFHLYDDEHKKNEIILSGNKQERKKEIDDFIAVHKKTGRSASFRYEKCQ